MKVLKGMKWILENRIWTVLEKTKVRESIGDWDELSVVLLAWESHRITYYRIALESGSWRRILWTTIFETEATKNYSNLIKTLEILDEGEDI